MITPTPPAPLDAENEFSRYWRDGKQLNLVDASAQTQPRGQSPADTPPPPDVLWSLNHSALAFRRTHHLPSQPRLI